MDFRGSNEKSYYFDNMYRDCFCTLYFLYDEIYRLCFWRKKIKEVTELLDKSLSTKNSGENKKKYNKRKSKLKNLRYASKCVYVYNVTKNKVELDYNGRKRMSVTSLVKLMNCRKAFQLMDKKNISLNSPIKLNKKAVMLTGKQREVASKYKLKEKLRYRDLIYAMMLRSDADSAKTVAIRLKGSMNRYVREMNMEAKALGLKDTKFVNVDGVRKKGQYSTCRDIVKLVRVSVKDRSFYKTLRTKVYRSKRTYEHPYGVVYKNTTVKRLEKYNNKKFRIIGGKYGYSSDVGRAVLVIAKKHNKTYFIVVMGNKHPKKRKLCLNKNIRDVVEVLKHL